MPIWDLAPGSEGDESCEADSTNRRAQSVPGKLQLQAKVNLQQSLCQLHGSCRIAKVQLPIVMETAKGQNLQQLRPTEKGVVLEGKGTYKTAKWASCFASCLKSGSESYSRRK